MTDKELRHLSRKELLEILLDQAKEITVLNNKVEKLEAQLEDRRIAIDESGTMAEAAARLNGLFADADKAAAQYVENARINEEESRRILENAQKRAEEIIAEAEEIRDCRNGETEQRMSNVGVKSGAIWDKP